MEEQLETPREHLIRAVAIAEADLKLATEDERAEIEESRDFFIDLSYLMEEGFITGEFDASGELRFFPA